jgi:hypothetical protein
MEGFPESDNLFPSIMKGGQFEGILIGFRAGIAKEELVILPTGNFSQPGRQFLLQGNDHGIGIKPDLVQLVSDAFHIMRVSMPDRDHGMPAVQVKVLLSLVVPNIGTPGLGDGDLIDGINVE